MLLPRKMDADVAVTGVEAAWVIPILRVAKGRETRGIMGADSNGKMTQKRKTRIGVETSNPEISTAWAMPTGALTQSRAGKGTV